MWLIEGNDTLNVICKYFRPQGRARSQALRTERLPKHIHHDRRKVDFARSSSLSYWSSSLSYQGWFCQSLFWWAWVLAVWVDRRKGGKVKSCTLIVIISSRAMFSDHPPSFIGTNTVWSTYHDGIFISQGRYQHHIKHRVWSNHHDGIFIKADKVKLCSLIIIISSIGQIPSDQLTMMVFWSVKGGKVKLHPLIVVLSSWEND